MMDAVASMWCNVWGHSNPQLIKAINEQSKKLQHSSQFNLTTVPAEELADSLVKISPKMYKVFYSDNGSSAMEIAIKAVEEGAEMDANYMADYTAANWNKQDADARKEDGNDAEGAAAGAETGAKGTEEKILPNSRLFTCARGRMPTISPACSA